ncbi:MAG TPA: hypothetical protein VFF82_01120 [Rhodocyclaceae bacterium]|nr:hypothetical protein [Rhodocyclaceae bacterium]
MGQSFDPGSVVARLTFVAGRVASTAVSCKRPDVARLLCGQPADRAVALVPLIYSLCGKAQGVAARAALAAARGNGVEAHVDAEVLAEAEREHAWKLLVDWPRQLGMSPDETTFVRLVRALTPERAALAAELRANPLIMTLRESLRPSGHGIDQLLLEQLEARLVELLDYLLGRPQSLGSVSATPTTAGVGEASVATARGPLVHRLTLRGDEVADYVITAPTDRHFAADGPVACCLTSLAGLPKDEAGRLAEHAIMAFDPCVPWTCDFD